MTFSTKISGWGNYPKINTKIIIPSSQESIKKVVRQETNLVARGMGRSYGDSANASKVLQTSLCDRFVKFDESTGLFTAEAGITLREILKLIVPKGWFLPVTPGTSFVTLGGAIASDVHGKNHHGFGTFGQHTRSLSIMLGTGEIVSASPLENADLYYATCAGMGLTGVILSATIQLLPIKSSLIRQKVIKANCIEAACEAFENNNSSTYSVAWIDCLSMGKNLGRSVLMLGEHLNEGTLELDIKPPLTIPFTTPSVFLNSYTIKTLNASYWFKSKHNKTNIVKIMPFFYPLDMIGAWNKFYGKAGFLQFQCVIPMADGVSNLRTLLKEIAMSGEGSFLAVLKKFGRANNNLLSFPIEGYTLALDFKLTSSALNMLGRLENIVMDMGGRIYLTKDAVMQEATFKYMYPNWEIFESVRAKYGAIGKFSSMQSKRLGLS